MAFGFGKIAGGFKNMGKAMTGKGGGVSAGPSQGFMSRFKQAAPTALNNAAQAFGGNMAPMARMTGQMGMRRPQAQPTQPNPPIPMPEGGINTGPSQNFVPNMGGMFGGGFGGSMGIWNPWARGPMELQDMSTGQSRTIPPPETGSSIFSRYFGNNRPQIYT